MSRIAVLLPLALGLAAASARAQMPDMLAVQGMARESYREFLELVPRDDPRRPEALRRLADLELEHAERLMLESDQPDVAASVYREAVRLYQALLADYPDRPDSDRVLYQLARAHDQIGEIELAMTTLEQLVTRFPNSQLIDESQFRRGEAFFSSGDFHAAADAYAAVLEVGQSSPFFEQSLYKHGWSLFRQVRYEEALESLFALLEHRLARDGAFQPEAMETLSRAEREMLDDALRAMSIGFSYLEGVSSLNAFLDRGRTPGSEHLLFQTLGDLYLSQERYNDAAEAYHAFVERLPDDDHAPVLQLAVIETYQKAGFPAKVLAAKEAFVEQYALTGSFWTSRSPADLPEVVSALKQHLTDLTAYYHALAQTSQEAEDYARAVRWYRAWLDSFPHDPQAPPTRFLLAELLFQQGQFGEATFEYEGTAYEYGPHARAAEAGYAALLAYREHAATLQGAELADWDRRAVDSAVRFAGTFPEHPEAPAVLAQAAEQLFGFGDFDRALDAAQALAGWQPPPDAELRRRAWIVIGHSLFDRQSYSDAEQAYVQVLALMPPDDDLATEITEKLAAAVYKQGEQQRAEGNLSAAVEHFMRVARVAPQSPIRATAEYDAAAALMQLEDWGNAAAVLEGFRVAHAQHELQGEVTAKLAVAYMESGEPARAAEEFERMARDGSPALQTRREAAWQAASYYEQAGNEVGAAAVYEYLVTSLSPPLDEAIDAREHLARSYAKHGNEALHLQWLESIIEADRAAGEGRTERSRSAAASAALTVADSRLQPFRAMQLVVPLKESLRLKKQSMEELLDAYAAAADYGVSTVTTAATYRIAELYRDLASALVASERPTDLTPEELEQYEILLEEQAFPFEEKAIETHELNAQRSAAGVYDEWVQESFTQLAELLPMRYAKQERGEAVVHYLQ